MNNINDDCDDGEVDNGDEYPMERDILPVQWSLV